MSNTIVVDYLDENATDEDVKEYFRNFGKIVEFDMSNHYYINCPALKCKTTRKCKCNKAIITFDGNCTADSVNNALTASKFKTNGREYGIVVSKYYKKPCR